MIRVYIDAGSAITRSGLESLLAADPDIEIVHDASEADVVVGESPRSGARGTESQDISPAQVVAAVHAAAAGLVVMPAEEGMAFLPHLAGHEPVREIAEALTPREMDVLEMLAEGLSNKMIAHRLSISDHTAKFHVNSILAKLNAGTRTEAVTRGIRLGLIKI
ncbi:MAG: transcriptional regulator, LuxR family [Bryobacterales bacterium]|nr:transcriptional regulator, LuxR family [Bryobacterales bacterium]